MNKLLSFAALITVSFAICGLIIYGVIQFAPSNDAKNVAYSQFGANYGEKTYEAFLIIPDIPGSSDVPWYLPDVIKIEEFSWSETQSGSTHAGAGASQVEMEDFQFIFEMDPKASPKLFLACAKGEFLEKVVLSVRSLEESREEFMKVTFNSVLISSFQTLGNTYQGQHPMDAITIKYSQIQFEYKDASGQQYRAEWDLPSNTGG